LKSYGFISLYLLLNVYEKMEQKRGTPISACKIYIDTFYKGDFRSVSTMSPLSVCIGLIIIVIFYVQKVIEYLIVCLMVIIYIAYLTVGQEDQVTSYYRLIYAVFGMVMVELQIRTWDFNPYPNADSE
jgi:hypothetical protein